MIPDHRWHFHSAGMYSSLDAHSNISSLVSLSNRLLCQRYWPTTTATFCTNPNTPKQQSSHSAVSLFRKLDEIKISCQERLETIAQPQDHYNENDSLRTTIPITQTTRPNEDVTNIVLSSLSWG